MPGTTCTMGLGEMFPPCGEKLTLLVVFCAQRSSSGAFLPDKTHVQAHLSSDETSHRQERRQHNGDSDIGHGSDDGRAKSDEHHNNEPS